MSKKLTSLADLAKMQFDNLAPDPEPQEAEDYTLCEATIRSSF